MSSGTIRTTSNALKVTITDKLVSHAHSNGHKKKSIEIRFIQLSAKTLYCSTHCTMFMFTNWIDEQRNEMKQVSIYTER